MKQAKRWSLASACALLILFAPGSARAGEIKHETPAGEIERLASLKEKGFADLVTLALLNRKLGDARKYRKWLASAAAAKPSAAFTSDRSPFVYVRVWSAPVPEDFTYLSVRRADDGAFYAALTTAKGEYMRFLRAARVEMRGADRFDPLTREVRRILINENKASFASSMGVDREGNFYLGHFGVVFIFAPNGQYKGQIVTMHRYKIREANTCYRPLDNGDAYVSDFYRHISRVNRHADTLKYIRLRCGSHATITGMAADKDENLFVGLIGDNQIVMLQPDLTERCRIGGTGIAPGQGLAVGELDVSNQAIVVCDPALRRMQVLDKNGAYMMEIPAAAFSVAINDRGTILALEGNRVVCYARFFKDELPQTDADFATYVNAVKMMEEGKVEEARQALDLLTRCNDVNLAQVSRSLMKHETLALGRHYEKPRWPTIAEVQRLSGRNVKELFLDPYDNCTWASVTEGFLIRVDESERVKSFDLFPALHGLTGKLTVDGMRLYENWCYASTNHGICRYSREHGDWQFVPGLKSLADASPDGR